jgi:hypothetical protein
MTNRIRRWSAAMLAVVPLLSACAVPGGPSPLETFGRGLAGLVLSPLMIVAGIAQGIGFLPYTLGTSLIDLNRALVQAQAVTLDDSYKATFNVPASDPRVNQQTGEISGATGLYGRYRSEAIFEANRAFQRLLVSQGMPPAMAEQYVLAGDYTYAWSRDQILLAVVHRHPGAQPFRAVTGRTGIATTFRPDQRGWYEPYARDVDGRPMDEVINWAALQYTVLRQDKVVATLMALAAEDVKSGKRRPDFWAAQQRWLAGETNQVMQESLATVKGALPAS